MVAREPSFVALVAGYFTWAATRPTTADVRHDIREFEKAQGAICLEWAARELDLPLPG
jgi:hypothetical protein